MTMKAWLLLALASVGMAFAADEEKASAKPDAHKGPAVIRLYADAISEEGVFTMARYATDDSQVMARGGMTLTVTDAKVVVSTKDSVVISAGGSGPSIVKAGETSGGVPADEYIVVIGKGERAVDFEPVAGADGKVQCRSVKVILLDRPAPVIVALPDTPLAGLSEAVKNAKPE